MAKSTGADLHMGRGRRQTSHSFRDCLALPGLAANIYDLVGASSDCALQSAHGVMCLRRSINAVAPATEKPGITIATTGTKIFDESFLNQRRFKTITSKISVLLTFDVDDDCLAVENMGIGGNRTRSGCRPACLQRSGCALRIGAGIA